MEVDCIRTQTLSPNNEAIDDLIMRFNEDCKVRNLVAAKKYVSRVREFVSFLSARNKSVLNVGRDDLKAFLVHLREKQNKQGTVDNIFVCLSAFYAFLTEEEYTASNPILSFRKRYLWKFKDNCDYGTRKIISIEDASKLVNSILDSRDKAIVVLLLKTGMRRKELCSLDLDDIDLERGEVKLKPTPKRSNRILYLDEEAMWVLQRWLQARNTRRGAEGPALFLSRNGSRLCSDQVERLVEKHAEHVGLHDSKSRKLEDHFGPHCCRHWFTTHLIRAGMPRDFVKELRGDSRHEAIDIYNHIDKKELRESYLAHIPQLYI